MRFCGECGAPLQSACPSCGAANPAENRCDIVDSTPLTERLGPEAMRDLVAAFLEASLGEVHRYGGTAPQFTGDGFLALYRDIARAVEEQPLPRYEDSMCRAVPDV